MKISKSQKIVALSAIGLFKQVNRLTKVPTDLKARNDAVGKWFEHATNCKDMMVATSNEHELHEMIVAACEAIIAGEEPANPTDGDAIEIVADTDAIIPGDNPVH